MCHPAPLHSNSQQGIHLGQMIVFNLASVSFAVSFASYISEVNSTGLVLSWQWAKETGLFCGLALKIRAKSK